MITKADAKEKIFGLVKHYNSKKTEFSKYGETDLRIKLIDRLFKFLGWDILGEENPDEVQREESIEGKEPTKKKADYVFRLGSVPKFVVEAKKIKGIDIHSEEFQKQAVGYSYNLACSWSILTNFKNFILYFEEHPFYEIREISNLDNFEKNFEILWKFSKKGIREEILEKEADTRGLKRSVKVDKQLYGDLKEWRQKLSSDIRKKYGDKYRPYEIEEIVQRIIDRLIFIRKIEDLGLEERQLYQLTRRFSHNTKYYQELIKIFKYYREKYNSGLFGLEEEQEPDRIDVSNNIIEKVITEMYRPPGKKIEYNFAAIDADILGNIYEQYLTYILQETPKRTKLEGGRVHRKEQGIYYTPTYIVDYIVKNTVGEYIKNKTIDEILNIRILDPACGSGSFLIRAFSELIRTIEEKLKKEEKSKKWKNTFQKINERLSLGEKTTILLNCIYGVDLDKKAVEIVQLNLLLKLLEGETSESISKIKTKKILPMLDNIKVGNSLIEDKSIDEKAFEWKGNFEEGSFNVVIGNPPYIRVQTIKKSQKEYLVENYFSAKGKFDLYGLFVEKSLKLLKKGGFFSFIIPNKFTQTKYGKELKKFILKDFSIDRFVNFGDLKVFGKVTTYPSIFVIRKNKVSSQKGSYIKVKNLSEGIGNKIILNQNSKNYEDLDLKVFKFDQKDLGIDLWVFLPEEALNILKKIKKSSKKKLTDLKERIYEGFITGNNSVFFLGREEAEKLNLEKELLKPVPKGKDVRRYSIKWENRFVLFPHTENKEGESKAINLKKFPNTKKYLEEKKKLLEKRSYVMVSNKNWYEIWNPRKIKWFKQDKIITPNLSAKNNFAIDFGENKSGGYFFIDHDCYGIILKEKKRENYLYLLGILNSKLIEFFIKQKSPMFSGGYYKYHTQYLEQIPIVQAKIEIKKSLISLVREIIALNKKLNALGNKQTDERKELERKIKETDNKIDQEVYKLYGITPEEQKIIEENLK